MANDKNLSIVFAKRPTGEIIPGETFRVETKAAPTEADLKDGEVLFESHYLSLDPSMRVWLRGKYAGARVGENPPNLARAQIHPHTCHLCRSARS